MLASNATRRATRRLLVAVAVLAASVAIEPAHHQAQAASEVVAVVNKTPITSSDVARRAAFLRLQRQRATPRPPATSWSRKP